MTAQTTWTASLMSGTGVTNFFSNLTFASGSGDDTLDTRTLNNFATVADNADVAISTLTLAELIVGLNATRNELARARRRAHLSQVETKAETLSFDSRCAQAWASIYAAVELIDRKPRGARAVDLMIAATALAHDLPLYTLNPRDLRGLEDLIEIVDLAA